MDSTGQQSISRGCNIGQVSAVPENPGGEDMAMDLHFEMRREYLYVQVTGAFVHVDEVLKALVKVQETADSHAATKILIDCLQLKGTPNTSDYYTFGVFAAEERAKHAERISAFVGTPPTFDKRHFGELVATNRGATMKSFDRIEDALEWLGVDPGEGRQSSP